MGQVGNKTLECIKELLPNFAASGLWEPLTGLFGQAAPVAAAAGTAAAVGGVIPTAVGLACVGALFGLKYVGSNSAKKLERHEADERRGMVLALETIRRGSKNAEAELTELGYEVKYGFKDIELHLSGIDDTLQSLAVSMNNDSIALSPDGLTQLLEELFQRQTTRLDDFCYFLQENHRELRSLGTLSSLPSTLMELSADIHTFRDHLTRVEQKVDNIGEGIAELIEIARQEKLSEEELKRKLREEIEREYVVKLAQERNAREAAERAAQAVIDVKDIPGIVDSLRKKGGHGLLRKNWSMSYEGL